MSRCFPFPPPGYEKKPRSDHEDLLIKEKHKEKKHRKEKRDKEKGEGKERKDKGKAKDHSKDKNKEKRDKKDKHRDKDKKKHKDRNKDKKKNSNERKGEECTESHNEKNLEGSFKAEHLKDPKFTEELGRRIRDEECGAGNQSGEKITGKVQRTFESMGSSAEKERTTGNNMVTGNKIIQSNTIPEQRMVMASATAMEERGTENKMFQNSVCEEPKRVNGVGRPIGQDAKTKIESKEKAKEKEVDYGKGDGHKRVQERMHKEKNKKREKEKEKAKEETREKEEHKHREQDQLRDVNKKEQVDLPSVASSFTPKDNHKSACIDGSLKRKQINGFCHENEMRYNKLSRQAASSSKLPLENGWKLDQSHIGSPCSSDIQEGLNLVKVERLLHKENKINGKIDIQPLSTMLGPAFISDCTKNGDSLKKPHPDEKYLSQILRVPKMEELPEFDDQDWLLSRDEKPKMVHDADESLQVWESAVRIETADVLALPYVIPY